MEKCVEKDDVQSESAEIIPKLEAKERIEEETNGNEEYDKETNIGGIENDNVDVPPNQNQPPITKRKLPSWMLNKTTDENAGEEASSSNNKRIKVKDEFRETVDNSADNTTNTGDEPVVDSSKPDNVVPEPGPVQVKTEPIDDTCDPQPSGSITNNFPDIKPAIKVEIADATSTTSRQSCKFGIRCYRRNPTHRSEEAHPGDSDYRRPDFPSPPPGTPDCPYGGLCYRRNPIHFASFAHPPNK